MENVGRQVSSKDILATMFFFSVSAGKYKAISPNGSLSIDYEDFDIFMPDPPYSNVATQLGIDDKGFIDCNGNQVINYVVGGLNLALQPEDYIDQDVKSRDGRCRSRIENEFRSGRFTLPVTFLRNQCLALDHATGKLGFASVKGAEAKNKVRRVGRANRPSRMGEMVKLFVRKGERPMPRNKYSMLTGKYGM
jgi:hypothetical protein